jgi:hypothetical protein
MSAKGHNLHAFHSRPLAVVMGTNEIASAVAVSLIRAGIPTVLSHDPYPPVIRRGMSFHDALLTIMSNSEASLAGGRTLCSRSLPLPRGNGASR